MKSSLKTRGGGRRLGIAKWLLSKEEHHQDDRMGCSGRRGLDSISFHVPDELHIHSFCPFRSSSSLLFSRFGSPLSSPSRSSLICVFLAFLLSGWTPRLASSAFPGWLAHLSPSWRGGHHRCCCALSSEAEKALIQCSEVMKMPGILFFFLIQNSLKSLSASPLALL